MTRAKMSGNGTAMPTAANTKPQRSLSDQRGHATAPTMHRANALKAAHVTSLRMPQSLGLDDRPQRQVRRLVDHVHNVEHRMLCHRQIRALA